MVLSVFFMTLSTISALMYYSSRYFAQGVSRGEAHEDRLRLVTTLKKALGRSAGIGNSMTYLHDQTELAYAVATPLDSAGNTRWQPVAGWPVYQAHEIYYRDAATETVRMIRVDLSTPTPSPSALTPLEITDAIANLGSSKLCDGVLGFQACSIDDWQVQTVVCNPQGFRLVQKLSTGATTSMTFEVKVLR